MADQNYIPESEQVSVLKDWDDIQATHQRDGLATDCQKSKLLEFLIVNGQSTPVSGELRVGQIQIRRLRLKLD